MELSALGANAAKSIEDMGNLLKAITNAKMGIEDKLMKADITEKVSEPAMGQNLDISA